MWEGQERRSQDSKLARALVAMKSQADAREAELKAVSRLRRRSRARLRETLNELRAQERQLLGALGARSIQR
jgi:hypothetical protein